MRAAEGKASQILCEACSSPNRKTLRSKLKRTVKQKKSGGLKKSQTGVLAGTRGWLAMGTLAAYAAMGAGRPAMAAIWKTDPAGGAAGGGAAATLPLKRFDIAAGPLDEAIHAYEKATGLSVK